MAVVDSKAITAQDVADYLLASVDAEAGDNISNLKLQKLLYLCSRFAPRDFRGSPTLRR